MKKAEVTRELKIRRFNVDEWAAYLANPEQRMHLILMLRKQGYDQAKYGNKIIWTR